MPQTLVIGDIHGCYEELQALLDAVGPTAEDTIVHIGDLTDRGPQPRKVVQFFMETPNAFSLMGNRDDKHVQAFSGEANYTGARLVTRLQIRDEVFYGLMIDYMTTLPLYMDLPDALLVHGMFEPGVALEDQRRDVLLGHQSGENYIMKRRYWPWFEYYDGEKPIIVGHRDLSEHMDIYVRPDRKVYGIDSRCVYGGGLTGLLLPSFKMFTVPARSDHFSDLYRQYGFLLDE